MCSFLLKDSRIQSNKVAVCYQWLAWYSLRLPRHCSFPTSRHFASLSHSLLSLSFTASFLPTLIIDNVISWCDWIIFFMKCVAFVTKWTATRVETAPCALAYRIRKTLQSRQKRGDIERRKCAYSVTLKNNFKAPLSKIVIATTWSCEKILFDGDNWERE